MGISQTPQAIVPAAFTSGGMTLLSTTTLTGSSVTVSSISGSYTNLVILLRDFRTSMDDRTINIRFNSDTGSNYNYANVWANVGSITQSSGTGTSLFINKGNISSTAINLGQGNITIPLYASTSYNKSLYYGFGSINPSGTQSGVGFGRYASTSAITSVTLFPDAGNFDAGTILIYGVN